MATHAQPDFSGYNQKVADAMIEFNRSVGGLPKFLGASLDRFEPGKLYASLSVRDELLTPMGVMHGGVLAGFVDHVLGCVLYPLMEKGQWAATTEFKLNYLAPVKGGRLEAESSVVSLGRRTAVIRVDVVCDETLVCTAQGTLTISAPPSRAAE